MGDGDAEGSRAEASDADLRGLGEIGFTSFPFHGYIVGVSSFGAAYNTAAGFFSFSERERESLTGAVGGGVLRK